MFAVGLGAQNSHPVLLLQGHAKGCGGENQQADLHTVIGQRDKPKLARQIVWLVALGSPHKNVLNIHKHCSGNGDMHEINSTAARAFFSNHVQVDNINMDGYYE